MTSLGMLMENSESMPGGSMKGEKDFDVQKKSGEEAVMEDQSEKQHQ